MSHTMHVVSHTHWDREWYQPFQQFRLRLVDLIDHLMDILDTEPDFHHFSLDAQTIVLEDYLAIRPHARERLTRYIREGRISVGPWYQLNDEFLVSGEATVRSLLIGNRIARSFGACLSVGYLPDQFGNLGQMPQILRGFGIDNAVMGRGYQLVDDRKMEFWWEAPDGSRVLASLMAYWYNNAQYMPSDPQQAVEWTRQLRDTMAERSAVSHLLFMNGVDHLEPQRTVGRTIRQVDDALRPSGDRMVHTSLQGYVDALRTEVAEKKPELSVFRGELREDRGGACLAGTLSSRMYLKQTNHETEVALNDLAERLCSMARIEGAAYPFDQLHFAWKHLMQNHPHDSMCGCSVDAVHSEMMVRFEEVQQIAEVMTDRALDTLCARDRTLGAPAGETAIRVLNTLSWPRTDPVTATIDFALGEPARSDAQRDDTRAPAGFRILDANGAEVPFMVLHTETSIQTVNNPHELPLDQWVRRFVIELVATDVPACGYTTYRIEPCASMPVYPDYTMAEAPASSLTLVDVADVGDEYLYRRPLNDFAVVAPTDGQYDSVQRTAVRTTETAMFAMDLPASGNVEGRSADRVRCPITVRRTSWQGVPRTEYEITVNNMASDHRLRAVFPAPFGGSNPVVIAEGQFDAVERAINATDAWPGASPFHPQQAWVDASPRDGSALGLTVINRGLPEYEVTGGNTPNVEVTLLRCVGQLSGRGDGPGIQTPGAQCHGVYTFHLAVCKHSGDADSARAWKQAHQFNVPMLAVQCPLQECEPSRSYVSIEPDCLVLTAVKRAEDRDSLIVRFFNITAKPVPGARIDVHGAHRMRQVNLDEAPVGEWVAGSSLTIEVAAKQIVTIEADL